MRRTLVLLFIGSQLAVYGALMWWSVDLWRSTAWAGFAWQAPTPVEARGALRDFISEKLDPGAVVAAPHGAPAAQAGIELGDVVRKVNGIPASERDRLRESFASMRSGDTLEVEVERDGVPMSVSIVTRSAYSSALLTANVAISVLVGLAFLGIAAVVAWARPTSTPARVFLWLASVGAAAFVVWAAIEPAVPDLRGFEAYGTSPWMLAAVAVMLALMLLLVNLLLHFALVFPDRRPVLDTWPQVTTWIHTLPLLPVPISLAMYGSVTASETPILTVTLVVVLAVVIAVSAIRLARAWRNEGGWRGPLAHPWWMQALVVAAAALPAPALGGLSVNGAMIAGIVWVLWLMLHYLVILFVWSIVTCVVLARTYREAGPEARQQLRWPIWGLTVPIALSLLFVVLGLVVGFKTVDLGVDPWTLQAWINAPSKLVYIAIPIAFAFGILRYRVMDIDVVVKRTLVYGGLTAFVLVAYLGLVALLGVTVVRTLGVQSEVTAVTATVVVAALCVPVRRWLQNAVDRRMLQRRLDHSRVLERADAALSRVDDLETFARGLVDDLHAATGARNVAVWIAEPGAAVLRPVATLGFPDEVGAHAAVPVTAPGLHGRTAVAGATVAELEVAGARAEIAAPARLADRLVGLVTLGPRAVGGGYQDDERRLVESVAQRLAYAAGSFLPNISDLESIEARRIQESLLPSTLPALHGLDLAATWIPAREVSGDGYDALALEDGGLLALVADVAGKGMPAALLMSNLQAAVRSAAVQTSDPAELAARVRHVVTPNLTGGRFVTFCILSVDAARTTLSWANLGHEPPILVRADGTVLPLHATGPAVARMLSGLPVSADHVVLSAGDRVVMWTDGVSEALDTHRRPFNREQVERVVMDAPASAAAIVESITDAVRRHAGGAFQDDVTVVAVTVTRDRT